MNDFARIWTRNLETLSRRASGHAAWVAKFQKMTGCTDEEARELIEERLDADRQDYRPGNKRKGGKS